MPDRPTLVLTRPAAQSARVAADIRDRIGDIDVVIAPIMRIDPLGELPDLSPYRGVILTSARALDRGLNLTGRTVYCVGEKTGAAARAAGGDVALVAQDADHLVAGMGDVAGPLIHLRGRHARGDVADRLSSAGIETHEAVIYDQCDQLLEPEARALLEGTAPVVLPLYSPRSAKLIRDAITAPGANLRALAMSEAVCAAWGEKCQTPAQPTAAAMVDLIVAALSETAG